MYLRYTQGYKIFIESRQTQEKAKNILTKNIENINTTNNIIKLFKNEKGFEDVMATLYLISDRTHEDINNIKKDVISAISLKDRSLINDITYSTKNGIKVIVKTQKETKIFDNYLQFSEYIKGIESYARTNDAHKEIKKISKKKLNIPEEDILFKDNGITIYRANTQEKCIKYGNGALTGTKLPFCIGIPIGGNMYYSYRIQNASSFYYIIDENENKKGDYTDRLSVVVFDNNINGINLTDLKNITNTIDEPYVNDIKKYIEYLKSKGIKDPNTLMPNIPLTEEEKSEYNEFKNENTSLEWFTSLPNEKVSKYVMRGHILTDEQLKQLLSRQ